MFLINGCLLCPICSPGLCWGPGASHYWFPKKKSEKMENLSETICLGYNSVLTLRWNLSLDVGYSSRISLCPYIYKHFQSIYLLKYGDILVQRELPGTQDKILPITIERDFFGTFDYPNFPDLCKTIIIVLRLFSSTGTRCASHLRQGFQE